MHFSNYHRDQTIPGIENVTVVWHSEKDVVSPTYEVHHQKKINSTSSKANKPLDITKKDDYDFITTSQSDTLDSLNGNFKPTTNPLVDGDMKTSVSPNKNKSSSEKEITTIIPDSTQLSTTKTNSEVSISSTTASTIKNINKNIDLSTRPTTEVSEKTVNTNSTQSTPKSSPKISKSKIVKNPK